MSEKLLIQLEHTAAACDIFCAQLDINHGKPHFQKINR